MTHRSPITALTVAVAFMFFSVATPLLAAGGQNGPNIAQFKTYRWFTVGGSEHIDEITVAQTKQAIDAQLTAKGLTKTDGTSGLEFRHDLKSGAPRRSDHAIRCSATRLPDFDHS
jgi:hypothetical protein